MATFNNDLRLKEIVTGAESGTWGTSTNTNLSLVADAFSLGTKNMAADANETFTMPDATADGTRSLYLKITSAVSLTATRTVTLAPNTVSKVWIIENATTGSQIITIAQGSGATVNVPNGSKLMIVTDGAGGGAAVFNANPTEVGGTVTSVGGTGTVNGITLTGTVTSSGNLTLGGTLSGVSLTTQVTGTLPIANGGTGSTSTTFANLTTNVTGTLPIANGGTGTTSTTFANLTTNVTGTLPVANGGTSLTTLTANNVILGNGSSAPTFVAPSTTGNVLTSNGSTWTSAVLPAGGLTYVVKTANYTTFDKEGVLADTTGGAFTVTLPATPATGAQVVVADAGANWGTNNLTVGRNGSTIGGLAQDLVCDITGASVQFVYDGASWEVYAQVGGNGGTVVTLDGTQTLTNKTINLTSNTLVATSAQMAAAVTDETGSGALVFATSPTLVTPALGTPASGNLSSCTADGTDAVGFRNVPQNSQSAAYTLVLADAGKHIFHPAADNNARTFTIPANSSVAYPIGTAITFINMAAANVTIAITSDTLTLSSAGTTGSRTLATNGSATCIKITSTQWLISGSGLT